jgi:hypothetical protein
MSLAVVEREVLKFLRADQVGVLCITGKWGVGKTFAWRSYLAKAQAENILNARRYSYVSLFGLNSLDQFRQGLVIGSLAGNADSAPSATLLQRGARFLRGRAELLQKVPGLSEYSGLFVSVAFSLLEGELFCIDDLERKGVGLSIRDVLGLITQLTQEKRCKVVIILNDGDLDGADKTEFETYHEKVIDLSLTYAPTPQECTQIALSASAIDRLIAKYAIELQVSNIRVLKKIQTKVAQIVEFIAGFDQRILQPIVQSVVLLAWCVYSPTEAVSLDFLKGYQMRMIGRKGDAEFTPDETKWSALLSNYGFTHFDEFDAVLLSGIKNGFFDESEVKKFAAGADAKIKTQDRVSVLQEAWTTLHGSFDDNKKDVVKAFVDGVSAAAPFMSIHDLFQVISVLKRLDEQKLAGDMISTYMHAHKSENQDFFDVDNHPFGSNITDDDLRGALRQKLATYEDRRSPRDVLIAMSKSRGWTSEDIALLSKLTEDDFYKLFKSTGGDDLSRIVPVAMQFARIGGIGADALGISTKARAALVKIGGESELNKVRVRKYGVSID